MNVTRAATQDTLPQTTTGLYAAVWRWHFYAGLFVAPFAVLLAVTGGIYLFKPQIEAGLYGSLYNVPAAAGTIDAGAQVSAAVAKFPGSVPEAYAPPATHTRSALVRMRTADSREMTVAVDPHDGRIIGSIDEERRPMQVIRDLHGTLLAGTVGQALQELAASWAMVLLVTGLYLWWPRRASAIWGTILPRLGQRGRLFWRDLHAVTAFWVSALLIFLVATGLPWTLVSGKLLNEVAGVVGKGMPDNGLGWGKGGSTVIKSEAPDQGWATTHAQHMAGAVHSDPGDGARPLALAKIVEFARQTPGIAPPFEIRLPIDRHGVFSIVTDSERSPEDTAYIHLDQYTGRVISNVRWQDFGLLAQGIALGVSLHEGLYFGLANQLLGLAACLGLLAMVTAGVVMWWRRRPAGRLGAPPVPRGLRVGPAIVCITVALGVLMPLMGASLLLVLALDWTARRLRSTPRFAGTLLVVLLVSAGQAKAQATPAAQAQETPAAMSLGEIVVTATRSPVSLTDVPASVSVVTSDQIRDTPAQGLDDILQLVPGMTLTQMGPDAAHPTAYNEAMRGLPTTNTRMLVLVDGVPVNDPFFGYIQWNRVPLNNIDHVEVVRGGGAPLWGNGAMGGVVNIITRTPDSQGIDVDAGGANFGTYRTGTYGAYFPTNWLKLSGNTGFSGTNGYQETPAAWSSFGSPNLRSPVYSRTSFDARNFNLRGDLVPSDGVSGSAVINYHENEQILSTPIGLDSQRTWSFSGNLKKEFGDGLSLAATLFHNDSNFTTNNPHLLTFTTEYNSNVHTTPVNDTGGSLILSRDFDGMLRNASIGLDLHYIDGTDRTNYLAPDGSLLVPTVIGGGDQMFTGVFAQARVVPISRLEIQASIREQLFENFNGVDTFPPAIGNIPASTQYSFDPRLNLKYSLTDDLAVRGAYYRSFKAPTLDQLYRTYADTTAGIFEGNPLLKPETLEGGEIGFDFTRPGVRNQLTFYSTNIHNIVTQRNLTAAESPPGLGVTCGFNDVTFTFLSCTQNINAAAAIARGIEEELTWDLGHGFSTVLAYTFTDSRYTANPIDPTAVGERLEGVPRHNASSTLTYIAPQGWRASVQLHWVSSSYGDPHPDDNLKQDAHFVVNASASYPLTHNVQLFAQIQNLLDRRYIANNGGGPPILGTPFTLFSGVRVSFD